MHSLSHMRRSALLALFLALALLVAPLAVAPVSANDRLKIVATTTIVADFVRNVVGENAEITTLVPPDSDAHTFTPSPSDSAAIAAADLIFEIGLGFESWLDGLYRVSWLEGAPRSPCQQHPAIGKQHHAAPARLRL